MLHPVEREWGSFERGGWYKSRTVRLANKGVPEMERGKKWPERTVETGEGPQGGARPRFAQSLAAPGCSLLSLPFPAFPEEREEP